MLRIIPGLINIGNDAGTILEQFGHCFTGDNTKKYGRIGFCQSQK